MVSGLILDVEGVQTQAWSRDMNGAVAASLVEQQDYVAMNPFYGPRGAGRRLAGLNAL